ncbi:unnamed protein product [Nippostrongylus brasiliensis]|uniref:Recep_L_domain domain-containing protein n=1 Tax=Nippostrongylus brasiliensis TaxID=27835 RepID=A0A158R0Q6_NIPBR|nr:unnamed protein product [Nippostrongylus brasiliensis]
MVSYRTKERNVELAILGCANLSHFPSVDHLVRTCHSSKTLGKAPNAYVLHAEHLTEQEFNTLFEEAEKVTMCVQVYNTNFRELRFPKLTKWVSCTDGPALRIIGNDYLERVVFNKSIKFFHIHGYPYYPETVQIRGNMRLSSDTIEEIASIFHTFRFFKPRIGECALPGLVKDLSVMNCRAYYGDVTFGTKLIGEVPTRTGHVDGCLVVENTLLNDIEFVRGFNFRPSHTCTNRIIGNKNLCISASLEAHLKRQMNITISDNLPYTCRNEVSAHLMLNIVIGLFFIVISLMAVTVKMYALK